jgi:hypothetical protein
VTNTVNPIIVATLDMADNTGFLSASRVGATDPGVIIRTYNGSGVLTDRNFHIAIF